MNKELIDAGNIMLAKICSDGKEVCCPQGLFPAETGYLLTFMKEDDKPVWWNKKDLKFHSSWDWLVPAVNICTKIIIELAAEDEFAQYKYLGFIDKFSNAVLADNITLAFSRLVELVQWHERYVSELNKNKAAISS